MKTSLIIQEPPLQVTASLAVAIGLNEALILQHINNMTISGMVRIIDRERWIVTTYKELQSEFFPFFSISTIQRAISRLEKSGLLLTRQPNVGISQTKCYRPSHQPILSK